MQRGGWCRMSGVGVRLGAGGGVRVLARGGGGGTPV